MASWTIGQTNDQQNTTAAARGATLADIAGAFFAFNKSVNVIGIGRLADFEFSTAGATRRRNLRALVRAATQRR
jgi:hypothetical protein